MSNFHQKLAATIRDQKKLDYHSPVISNPNSKLAKDKIFSFNLPAGFTCPGAGSCNGGFCYAQTGRYIFKNVMEPRAINFLASKNENFVVLMIDRIKSLSKKIKYLRIHDSGDFYSQDYINKWCKIINSCPEIKFYAYTKSFMIFDFSEMQKIPHMNVIQSCGSLDDSKIDTSLPHAKIFHSIHDLRGAGYVDCSEHDILAADGAKLVGLVIHPKTKKNFPE